MQEFSKDICNNCQLPIQETDKYCHACGQKNISGKVTVRGLLNEFFDNYLNLNAKLPRTLFALFFKPGKLTQEYFVGKHQSYLRPIRLFGVSTILFLALLAFQMSKQHFNEDINEIQKNILAEENKRALLTKIDSSFDFAISQTSDLNIESVIDSTLQPFRDMVFHEGRDTDFDTIPVSLFHIRITNSGTVNIKKEDFFTMSGKDLVEKYEVTDFWQRLTVMQTVKVAQETDGFSRYIIGLVPWMLFLMIPFFAMILKLVYIRRKQFYVEHLVFAFHGHAFIFIFLLLFVVPFQILNSVYDNPLIDSVGGKVQMACMIGISIYLFVAMKRFYGQSTRKTLLKFFILFFTYIFIFVAFSALFILASLLLF